MTSERFVSLKFKRFCPARGLQNIGLGYSPLDSVMGTVSVNLKAGMLICSFRGIPAFLFSNASQTLTAP